MRFSAHLKFLLLANALAAAISVDTGSIARAVARGIDVYGSIPSDAVKIADGHYTAEPGTKAWDWIRAQIDRQPGEVDGNKKREYANIGIGMFAQDWCTVFSLNHSALSLLLLIMGIGNGQAAWFDNVQYDAQHYDTVNHFSVGISYRGLRSNEQLDFSGRNGGDWCGTYLYSAGQNTGSEFNCCPRQEKILTWYVAGCFNSQAINCFSLHRH